MRLVFSIAGALCAVAAGVVSAPGSARALPLAPGAMIALEAEAPALTHKAQYGRYYDPRIRCIRAPCYVQRPYRPWYARRHYRPYYGRPRVVCRIRYGYDGPRQVCRRVF